MKYRVGRFFFLLGIAFSVASHAETSPISLCYQPVALPDILASLDASNPAIRISSAQVELTDNQTANFSGQVQITYRDTLLNAPQASFSRENQTMSADGGIEYYSSGLMVNGSYFNADLQHNSASLGEAHYQITGQAGRGYAGQLTATEKFLTLEQSYFTTCPDQDNSWALHAENITIAADDGWGEARHAVFRIKDIPVLYLPYVTFPVNEQRKTGLLLPKIGSSQKSGLELELPYYFNLAENYDLTLTPRYMSQRGMQLKSEFRYLTEQHQGLLQLEYLDSDNDKAADFGKRYLSHISQRSDFSSRLRAHIDFTDVSDDAYLAELGSDYNNQSDTQLYREASLNYFGDTIYSQLRLQGFEILGNYQNAYQTLPEFVVSSARPIATGPFDLDWTAQYTHFKNDYATIHTADRLHLEPSISLPFITPALEINTQASLLYTYYQQKTNSFTGETSTDISRTIPKLRIHAKLNMERDYHWFGESGLQTFEPQLQYLYIPYRDQQHIGLFDTTRLQDDYFGLFRENRYSGLDRINEANQVTVGWTTRFYDETDNELFRFSLGQIFFLSDPTESTDPYTADLTSTESMLAAEMSWHWHRRWYFSAATQYDADSQQLVKSNILLDYRAREDALFQLNHRYSRAVSGMEIQQLGAMGTLPISSEWQLVSSYYRDMTNNRMIDATIGVQYASCCWAVRLIAKRQILTNLDISVNDTFPLSELDTSIGLQFVLKGFGDKAGFSISDMLSNGIFNYRRPYLLTN